MATIGTVEPAPAATPVYFDSALIAKFYLNETGREAVRALATNAGIVVTSGIALAEISAAFHRKLREESVDSEVFKALHGQFQHDVSDGLWRMVPPSEALLEEVGILFSRLAKSGFLRSLDAVHLVTAKAEGFRRIYSNDRHLLNACASVGLEGVNPIPEYPQTPPKLPPRKKRALPRMPRHK